jgi:hypothetical protein
VFISKYANNDYLPYLGYLALIPMIGFFYIWLTGSRKTGGEVFGDKIWWNHLRPVHGTIYGLFAYAAINKNENAWIFLLIDVVIGLVSFLRHHYLETNFNIPLR